MWSAVARLSRLDGNQIDAAIVSGVKSSTHPTPPSKARRPRFRTFFQNLGQLHYKGCCLAHIDVVGRPLEFDAVDCLRQLSRPTEADWIATERPHFMVPPTLFCSCRVAMCIHRNNSDTQTNATSVCRIVERSML